VSAASSVAHDTVAALKVTAEDVRPEMTGAVVSSTASVVKVKSADVARLPAASRERTR